MHCGVRQHQQKGMKAQLLVGGGEGDIPNIPGISGVPEAGAVSAGGHSHSAAIGGPAETTPVPGTGGELVALLAAAGLVLHARHRRPR